MKPDRIKISKEFHINGEGLWLTADMPIAPDEDIVEEFKTAKSLLVKAFRELCEPDLVPLADVLPVDMVVKTNGSHIAEMRSCTDIVVLQTYKIMVKGKPEEQKVYDEMVKKLTKKKSHNKLQLP